MQLREGFRRYGRWQLWSAASVVDRRASAWRPAVAVAPAQPLMVELPHASIGRVREAFYAAVTCDE
jgi:hypothetical protein